MLLVLLLTFFNMFPFEKVVVIAFTIAIGSMLSGYSLTAKLDSPFISYLGKLSMPIFIWHWLVGTAVSRLNQLYPLSPSLTVILYFAGTFVLSVTSYWLVNRAKVKKTSR